MYIQSIYIYSRPFSKDNYYSKDNYFLCKIVPTKNIVYFSHLLAVKYFSLGLLLKVKMFSF